MNSVNEIINNRLMDIDDKMSKRVNYNIHYVIFDLGIIIECADMSRFEQSSYPTGNMKFWQKVLVNGPF